MTTLGKSVKRSFTDWVDIARRGPAICAALLVAMIVFGAVTRTYAAETIIWETYATAILRIDGDPPKIWGLFHSTRGKKDEVLLLMWGKRYIKIDTHQKEVRELDPGTITHQKDKLLSPTADPTSKVLQSNEWILRDVGSAYRIRMILTGESHEIEINLPH